MADTADVALPRIKMTRVRLSDSFLFFLDFFLFVVKRTVENGRVELQHTIFLLPN